jgi:hypothetical protein
MTKRKRNKKKHSGQRTLKDSKSDTSDSRKSIGSKVWLIVQIVVAVLALCTAYVTFKPRIDVRPGDAYDSSNPATTSFIIKNQGHVSIYDVVPSSPMNVITYPGDITAKAQVPFANSFSIPEQIAKVIAPGKEHTIDLPFSLMENNKIEESDIVIKLTFKWIKWLPWPSETTHRFVSFENNDGQWKWRSQLIE